MESGVEVRRGYIDGRWGQVHVRTAGVSSSKAALLCIHMSPMSGRIYEQFIAQIGIDRLAIAPDTPGFGMSDAPHRAPEIGDYAQDFSDLIDRLDYDGPIDVIGYHTGSMTGPDLAILRPDRIRRVIMISAPIYSAEHRAEVRRRYRHKQPRADGGHVAELWRSMMYWHPAEDGGIEEVADLFPEMLLGRDLAWWGHRAAFNHALEERLPLIEQPILVLNPKDDIWDRTPNASAYLRNGRIVDLPGWAHGFLRQRPDEAASLVRSFLDAPDESPFAALDIPADALVDRPFPTDWAEPVATTDPGRD